MAIVRNAAPMLHASWSATTVVETELGLDTDGAEHDDSAVVDEVDGGSDPAGPVSKPATQRSGILAIVRTLLVIAIANWLLAILIVFRRRGGDGGDGSGSGL